MVDEDWIFIDANRYWYLLLTFIMTLWVSVKLFTTWGYEFLWNLVLISWIWYSESFGSTQFHMFQHTITGGGSGICMAFFKDFMTMEVNWPYCTMMVGWILSCDIIGHILGILFPRKVKLVLVKSTKHPIKAQVYSLKYFFFGMSLIIPIVTSFPLMWE